MPQEERTIQFSRKERVLQEGRLKYDRRLQECTGERRERYRRKEKQHKEGAIWGGGKPHEKGGNSFMGKDGFWSFRFWEKYTRERRQKPAPL